MMNKYKWRESIKGKERKKVAIKKLSQKFKIFVRKIFENIYFNF